MTSDDESILFCIPIFNDWETAQLLLADLDQVLNDLGVRARVLFVDDGSTDVSTIAWNTDGGAVEQVEILTLRRNVGHQRAIALGLAFAYVERGFDAVVVMDGDGEDAARDAVKLIEHWRTGGRKDGVVFASRARRSESLVFRAFYQAFKLMHVLLTGKHVEVGNFSLVPRSVLSRLVVSSEIWNHYSAGVFKSRLPTEQIPIPRARRLAGKSRMNFSALVVHGLSAISVYGETVGVRVATGFALLIGAMLVSLAGAWVVGASGSVMLAGLVVLSTFVTAFCVTVGWLFLVLHGRSASAFLPVRDYKHFVVRATTVPATGAVDRVISRV